MHSEDFGEDFVWGVSSSAFQTEGSLNIDGRGRSIWDVFVAEKAHAKTRHLIEKASDFYNRYVQDIVLMKYMNIRNFRFSLSWPRLIPEGTGASNSKGIDFYQRVIDYCLEMGITPWVTLYHWDLPQQLELKGGWTNRDICGWFEDYVQLCEKNFGDRVQNWMILNEPLAFTGAGYFLGQHAPGRKGINNFLSAAHHAVLCQAIGARVIKSKKQHQVGSTYSYSHIDPFNETPLNIKASLAVDAVFNRMFIEPGLGLGYPSNEFPLLRRMDKFMMPSDEKLMEAKLDFIGLQTYTREVVAYSAMVPYLKARFIKASERNVPTTSMGWEVYPQSIYLALQRLNTYDKVKKIIVTENGAAFEDTLQNKAVHDPERIEFFKSHIAEVKKAKQEGIPVKGYFAWSLTDNFEWAEGFEKRFGLVYIDYKNMKRYVKSSGRWYKDFLKQKESAI